MNSRFNIKIQIIKEPKKIEILSQSQEAFLNKY